MGIARLIVGALAVTILLTSCAGEPSAEETDYAQVLEIESIEGVLDANVSGWSSGVHLAVLVQLDHDLSAAAAVAALEAIRQHVGDRDDQWTLEAVTVDPGAARATNGVGWQNGLAGEDDFTATAQFWADQAFDGEWNSILVEYSNSGERIQVEPAGADSCAAVMDVWTSAGFDPTWLRVTSGRDEELMSCDVP